jgi:hypothetical protein
METKKNPDTKSSQKWLISKVYSEFNSGKFFRQQNPTQKPHQLTIHNRCLARQPGRLRPAAVPSSPSPQQDAQALHLRLNDHQAAELSQLSSRFLKPISTTIDNRAERSPDQPHFVQLLLHKRFSNTM